MTSSLNSNDSHADGQTGFFSRRRYPLRVLKMAVLLIALLPMTIISIGQGMNRLERENQLVKQKLSDGVIVSGIAESSIITRTQAAISNISGLGGLLSESPEECTQSMQKIHVGLGFLANISITDDKGRVICAFRKDTIGMDVSKSDWWQKSLSVSDLQVSMPIYGRVVKRDIMVMSQKTTDQNGKVFIVYAAIDMSSVKSALHSRSILEGAVVALLDENGKLIASSSSIVDPIFDSINLGNSNNIYSASDVTGAQWSYAIAPLVENQLYVAYAVPNSELYFDTYMFAATDFGLPFVALLFAALAIWVGTERWVMSGLRNMRQAINAYAGGNYRARIDLNQTEATEVALVIEGLHRMAVMADERDRKLVAAITQKDMLVLEINHRVKNNLQIVMSLLSLQLGKISNPQARDALEQTRMRIGALAVVHRTLLEIDRLNVVDCQVLLDELCNQLRIGYQLSARQVSLDVNADHLDLPTDIASPLSLFTVEAITNALRHGMPDQRSGRIQIDLQEQDGRGMLKITDDGIGFDPETGGGGTGSSLLRAFASQMQGQLSIVSKPGGPTIVSLEFSITHNDMTDEFNSAMVASRAQTT